MSSANDVTTTLKLQTCSFCDMKIYPGRGQTFISKDGKPHIFLNSKVESLYHQHKKPARIRWTLTWRRDHKKALTNVGVGKKKVRTTVRTQKAIAGLSVDDIERKKAEVAARQAKEVKPSDAAAKAPVTISSRKQRKAPAKTEA